MNSTQKVVVALSGGVDSAVTAALLLEQGYEVIGVYMQLLPGSDCGDSSARQVAQELGIEFHSLDCKQLFAQHIVQNFCHEYLHARTPNPCILCNRDLKFGYLLQIMRSLGADYLATGHYARVDSTGGSAVLRRASDLSKDQSYFLFTLQPHQLSQLMFPLENLTKEQVQQLAQRFNLSAADRSESQDICFIPDNNYIHFLEQQLLPLPGAGSIIHVNGTRLGSHQGIHRYTIGQRRGLGIAWHEPLYVIALDADSQCIIVGEKSHLQRFELIVDDVVWTQPVASFPVRVDCRIRYRHREAAATVSLLDNGQLRVVFEQAQSGVTPGQAAVFYQQDCVLGGGWIQ